MVCKRHLVEMIHIACTVGAAEVLFCVGSDVISKSYFVCIKLWLLVEDAFGL